MKVFPTPNPLPVRPSARPPSPYPSRNDDAGEFMVFELYKMRLASYMKNDEWWPNAGERMNMISASADDVKAIRKSLKEK